MTVNSSENWDAFYACRVFETLEDSSETFNTFDLIAYFYAGFYERFFQGFFSTSFDKITRSGHEKDEMCIDESLSLCSDDLTGIRNLSSASTDDVSI